MARKKTALQDQARFERQKVESQNHRYFFVCSLEQIDFIVTNISLVGHRNTLVLTSEFKVPEGSENKFTRVFYKKQWFNGKNSDSITHLLEVKQKLLKALRVSTKPKYFSDTKFVFTPAIDSVLQNAIPVFYLFFESQNIQEAYILDEAIENVCSVALAEIFSEINFKYVSTGQQRKIRHNGKRLHFSAFKDLSHYFKNTRSLVGIFNLFSTISRRLFGPKNSARNIFAISTGKSVLPFNRQAFKKRLLERDAQLVLIGGSGLRKLNLKPWPILDYYPALGLYWTLINSFKSKKYKVLIDFQIEGLEQLRIFLSMILTNYLEQYIDGAIFQSKEIENLFNGHSIDKVLISSDQDELSRITVSIATKQRIPICFISHGILNGFYPDFASRVDLRSTQFVVQHPFELATIRRLFSFASIETLSNPFYAQFSNKNPKSLAKTTSDFRTCLILYPELFQMVGECFDKQQVLEDLVFSLREKGIEAKGIKFRNKVHVVKAGLGNAKNILGVPIIWEQGFHEIVGLSDFQFVIGPLSTALVEASHSMVPYFCYEPSETVIKNEFLNHPIWQEINISWTIPDLMKKISKFEPSNPKLSFSNDAWPSKTQLIRDYQNMLFNKPLNF